MAEKYITQTALQRFFTGLKSQFALSSHTHNYAGSSSAGGSATYAITATSSYYFIEEDNRDDNQLPSWYLNNRGKRNCYEFKFNSVIGLSSLVTCMYSGVSTFVSWGSISGGLPVQLATNNEGVFYRVSSSLSEWGSWKKIANTNDIPNSIITLSLNGKTISYTKKDGTTGTLVTQDTTYSVATTSVNGLMSSSDKSKLDGLSDQTLITNAEIDGVCV